MIGCKMGVASTLIQGKVLSLNKERDHSERL
jgi:hypothetical protein